jgi:hypothetical protein
MCFLFLIKLCRIPKPEKDQRRLQRRAKIVCLSSSFPAHAVHFPRFFQAILYWTGAFEANFDRQGDEN